MRPRAWWAELPADPVEPPLLSVDGRSPRPTGLLDAAGNPIMAEPEPIGFPITRARR